MLPLRIDPSVSMCVICYMELVVWVYRAAHKFTSDRSCVHTLTHTQTDAYTHTHTHSCMQKIRSVSL